MQVMAIVMLFLVMSVDGGLVMQRASFRDRFFIAFEVFAQLALFTFSFIFHLFDAHSENTYLRLVKCDYFGIILAFSLSLSCFSYFAFACDSALRIGYVLFFFAAVFPASFVLLSPSMASPRHRALRAFSFAATIGTGLVAVAHFAFREVIGAPEGDPTAQAMRSVLSFCLQSYGAQVVLVLLYVWRFPERYIRSWWIDHWFHSHTICHVICAASSLHWFRAILEISDLRLRQVPACL
jgi:adiponectin receptor